ncbi:multicystatin-like [Salvia hispanica]|uniref:multicystatin-like n=1 Tax=Salvia hispanica TaxID=49212 RepID=UPI0020096B35|nr:multicystatin-like [Salvia hispanica]
MASSMTMATSFFGGAVATKPATATTRPSQQTVRALMDLEKVVAAAAETTNTRRGLVLAGMAAVAASSVAKAATAAPILGAYSPVNPCTPEILENAKFAVSEYNKKNNAALVVEYVTSAESRAAPGFNYQIWIVAKDTRTGDIKRYVAVVVGKYPYTSPELLSFDEIPPPLLGAYSPLNPCTLEILEFAKIAVSEYNNKNKAALAVEYVTSAETAPVAAINYKLGIAAKDTRTGTIDNYVAVVASKFKPIQFELISFEPLRN